MPPEKRLRPSIDGVRRQVSKFIPEYRADHELPAPDPTPLLRENDESQQAQQLPGDTEIPTGAPLDSSDKPLQIHNRRRKWIVPVAVSIVIVLVVAVSTAYSWYQQQLAPVSTDTTKHIRVVIPSGTAPGVIADKLQSARVIRNSLAFTIYTKLSRSEYNLKAGTYSLQPSLSTQAIVDHLVQGKQDTFDVTFLPGDTITNNRQKLISLGYSNGDVDKAFNMTYSRPLFDTKPAGTDLEGYLYGETIEFDSSATADQILNRFFDQYESFITENNIVSGFQKQGLTLFQGITLASIVQREVRQNDMAQVARVFLNRMKAGMTLGSDVTYQYAAKKMGVAPSPSLDSPYNTRKYTGLPPGPIATPGNTALLAVANPANNDYLFFLSGDDGVTYFSKTDAGHQQNIVQHCQKKCAIN